MFVSFGANLSDNLVYLQKFFIWLEIAAGFKCSFVTTEFQTQFFKWRVATTSHLPFKDDWNLMEFKRHDTRVQVKTAGRLYVINHLGFFVKSRHLFGFKSSKLKTLSFWYFFLIFPSLFKLMARCWLMDGKPLACIRTARDFWNQKNREKWPFDFGQLDHCCHNSG